MSVGILWSIISSVRLVSRLRAAGSAVVSTRSLRIVEVDVGMALTDREKKIVLLKNKGLSDAEIGRRLRVSPESIGWSRRNALSKIERAQKDLEFAKKVGLVKS